MIDTITGLRFFVIVLAFQTHLFAGEVEECRAISSRYNLINEFVLADGARVDLLSNDFAIEADWSEKWAEGIGQALFYANETSKKPGVLILRKTETTDHQYQAHMRRCLSVCEKHSIYLWVANEGNSKVSRVYPKDPFSTN